MTEVLMVVSPGVEEIESLAAADVLVRAGLSVTVASGQDLTLRGSRNLPMAADCLLDEAILKRPWDLVYLPGGLKQAHFCRDDARVQQLLSKRLEAKAPTAIICASPISLLPLGLARGRRLTSHPSVREQLAGHCLSWVDDPVVRDGCLWTSQGPGTAIHFALCLAAFFAGRQTAEAVANTMLFDPAWTCDESLFHESAQ